MYECNASHRIAFSHFSHWDCQVRLVFRSVESPLRPIRSFSSLALC